MSDFDMMSPLLEEEQYYALDDYSKDLKIFTDEKNPIIRDAILKKIVDTYRDKLGFSQSDVLSHCALLEVQGIEEEREKILLSDLLDMQVSSPDWLVPELIAAGGGLTIVAGAPKTGKTLTFVYQLTYSVAVSGDFLGLPCKVGKVLLYQCEESTSKVSRTFRSRGLSRLNPAAQNAIANNAIKIINDFDVVTDFPDLKKEVAEFKPDLIIFDSLRAITKELGVSENSPEISKPFYIMQKILNYLKVPGVVIHHMSKNGKERGIEGLAGSLSLAGASDGVVMLDRDDNAQGHFINLRTAPREGTPVNWLINRIKPPEGYWEYIITDNKTAPPDQIRFERKILGILADNPGGLFSREDLAQALDTPVRDYLFNNAVDRLVDSLQIVEDQVDTQKFMLWLPPASPWTTYKPKEDSVNAQAEKLLTLSRDEIEKLVLSWSPLHKQKVWSVLTPLEQEKVKRIRHPNQFSEGDWVKDKLEGELHKIESMELDPKTKTWTYVVEGSKRFLEADIFISQEYTYSFEDEI